MGPWPLPSGTKVPARGRCQMSGDNASRGRRSRSPSAGSKAAGDAAAGPVSAGRAGKNRHPPIARRVQVSIRSNTSAPTARVVGWSVEDEGPEKPRAAFDHQHQRRLRSTPARRYLSFQSIAAPLAKACSNQNYCNVSFWA